MKLSRWPTNETMSATDSPIVSLFSCLLCSLPELCLSASAHFYAKTPALQPCQVIQALIGRVWNVHHVTSEIPKASKAKN